MFTAAGLSAV
jgi:hypothetical protein